MPQTFLHRLLSLAREGWQQRPQVEPFDTRAAGLRTLAVGLDSAVPSDPDQARTEQATYVKLSLSAQESPREAVWEGWADIEQLLKNVARRHGVSHGGGTFQLLNTLEAQRLLDFHAYALLRDLHSFHLDSTTRPPEAISLPAAQDHAVAVRSAQRVLLRLAAAPAPSPR